MNSSDWKHNIAYPYIGRGTYGVLTDPNYIKDRDECFLGNNGWWWGKGWWSGDVETPMERNRKYRERKEKTERKMGKNLY